MNDLNEASSESEELIARGEDDGDDIVIILLLSVRDTHKIILQLASFLNKLFQYSGKIIVIRNTRTHGKTLK